jgi:hypothetical protein
MRNIIEEEECNDVFPCCTANDVGTLFFGVDGGVCDREGVGDTEEGESADLETDGGCTEEIRTNRGADHGEH